MSAAGGGELEDECGEWLGQHDGLVAEPEPDVLAVFADVVDGEAADRGGSLGVEEKEQAGGPVLGLDGVVVEQAAGVALPASVSMMPVGRSHRVAAKSRPPQLLPPGPADKVPGLAAVGGVVAGQPGVEVALPDGG